MLPVTPSHARSARDDNYCSRYSTLLANITFYNFNRSCAGGEDDGSASSDLLPDAAV